LAPWLAPDWGSQDLSNDHLGLLSRPSGSKRLREQRDEDEDPWSLWSPLSRREVRWGHPEVVAQQLADRSIGIELSRHLIKVYFESVHYILRIVSPEEFYLDWQRAEERSDRMPPDQEVLCAVIEAWAAHFSDHPVVSCWAA
jgi:hypothetical protein